MDFQPFDQSAPPPDGVYWVRFEPKQSGVPSTADDCICLASMTSAAAGDVTFKPVDPVALGDLPRGARVVEIATPLLLNCLPISRPA